MPGGGSPRITRTDPTRASPVSIANRSAIPGRFKGPSQKYPIRSVVSRMNYLSPIANDICWHHAVETLFGIDITPRCKVLRTIMAEHPVAMARCNDLPAQRVQHPQRLKPRCFHRSAKEAIVVEL